MQAIYVYALTQIKRFFRDPVALFFTILFPLIFLFVFGFIFRGTDDISFKIAVINKSDSAFSEQFVKNIKDNKSFEIDDTTSLDEARELMGKSELDSILELPDTFGQVGQNNLPTGDLNVYYNESSPETGQTVASVMDSVLTSINQEITGQQPLFTVNQKATTSTGLSQFDFIFSGLLGFSIMSLAIFGLANQFPAEKKTGSLRRLRATPFTSTQLVIGTMLYYGFIGMISLVVMILVGLFVFNFDMRGDWFNLGIFGIISLAMMLGFGVLIGGWAKNENQSAVLTNIISFPLMFLSGVFFPRFLMPEWLQGITGFLPLTPIIDGIRFITTEGATLLDLGPQLAVIGVWALVVYAFAIKLFRWE